MVQNSGISPSEAAQIAIIAFLDRGDSIVQQVSNTERIERLSGSIVYAGSGSYPAILDIDDEALAGDLAGFRRLYLNRLMMMLTDELITFDNAPSVLEVGSN